MQIFIFFVLFLIIVSSQTIGFHPSKMDKQGNLLPWTKDLKSAVDLGMEWYLKCPIGKHNYPVFVYNTFMTGDYVSGGYTILPGTQLGMGIISYVKYWKLINKTNPKVLTWAVKMGDYIVNEALTPSFHSYPSFPRSTGINLNFPILVCSQADIIDGIETIEPDKGGISAYALYLLYKETNNKTYLNVARNAADTLVSHMRPGDNMSSPWPFRVDALGLHYQEKSCNMVYILRLFDALISEGMNKYKEPFNILWKWIRDFQIPAPYNQKDNLWINFFEDMIDLDESDRTSWCPLETARFIIEKKEKLEKNWRPLVDKIFDFAMQFSSKRMGNVVVMGEQDTDHKPWGGACSNLGGVSALYGCANNFSSKYMKMGMNNLAWMTYFIDSDGCPSALADTKTPQPRGGWQQDAHFDVIHNYVDGINALKGVC